MTQVTLSGSRERQAIVFMLTAILAMSVMDATVKGLAPRVGVVPALWARYAGQMLVVTLLILPRARGVVRTRRPGAQILRSALLMGATGFFFTSLSLIPLSEAAALMSVNPVIITLGAALFLGEKLGPRRIVGIAVALLGAFIIIRPGSSVFSPAALLPLGAACCYSAYALLTRRIGADEDIWTSLFYTGIVGTLVLSALIPFVWTSLDATSVVLMLVVAAAGTTGQLFMIRAFSAGEAAMLAPYAYVGLILAAMWGLVLYNEVPDLWTVVGAAIISCAGLYVWYRETHRN
ncbi:MAG: hypothetical protein CML68_08090 [Rhodobacteraceae bacterium]|nr:hypothetical protein [Paracoccaceae bacterium]